MNHVLFDRFLGCGNFILSAAIGTLEQMCRDAIHCALGRDESYPHILRVVVRIAVNQLV